MSSGVDEVRAMLALFGRSAWRDLYVRTGGWEIFLARAGGVTNPMVGADVGTVENDTVSIAAPHLGLFFPACATGDVIGDGDVIGQIEVLDHREDIRAERAGRIAAMLIEDGALVEYGTPLLRMSVPV